MFIPEKVKTLAKQAIFFNRTHAKTCSLPFIRGRRVLSSGKYVLMH